MSNQIVISSGAKVRSLEGVLTGTAGIVNSVPLGGANGVATLDSSGKVPVSQLPASVVTYLGTWNAATNTPTLTNGVGDAGDLYICNVAGTVNFGAGPITFAVGDWVIYGSGTWQKSSGQNGTVTSVAASINGNAIGITGSPITTAGTLTFAFAGTSGQYINGAGNLVTFPTLTGYVPYTGATTDVDLGVHVLNAQALHVKGTAGAGHLGLKHQSAAATGSANESLIYANVDGDLAWQNNNLYLTTLSTHANTANRVYTFPDASGTIALTSDISYPVTSVFGRTGAVTAQSGDYTTTQVTEGTNLYYTDARARGALSFTAGSGAYNSTTGVITIPTNTNQLTNGASFITLTSLSAGTGISYNNTTGVISSTITQYTDAMARAAISLTTSGTSGAATYNSTTGVLNVPNYGSALSGYVPYSGATGSVNLGANNNLTASTLFTSATADGGLWMTQASSITGLEDSTTYTSIKAYTSRYVYFSFGQTSTYKRFRFDVNGLSNATTITYTMPNADGTLALTSDIPSLANYVTLTGTQTITGVKTFSNEQLFGNGLTINNGFLTFADSGFSSTLDTTTLTASRAILLPNASGTLALTSQLTSGTVTSVGLSSATSGVTIGSSPITTSGTITLAIATASGSQQGLLSSTDWTTFNNKQNALTNPVTGTGTTNYHAKFTGSTTLGNSLIWDNGTNVGIGNTNTSYTLDVSGTGRYVGALTLATTGYVGTLQFATIAPATLAYDSGAGQMSFNITAGGVGTTPYYVFKADSSSIVTMLKNGNIGIGNTNPSYLLDVSGIISSNTEYRLNYSFARLATLDSGAGFGGGYNFNWNNTSPKHDSTGALSGYAYASDGTIRFYTDGSAAANTAAPERLRINSNGYITLVGSNAQIAQTVSNAISGDNAAVFYNTHATNSYGVYIAAGTGSNHALYITNAARSADLFKVQGNGYLYCKGVYNVSTGDPANVCVDSAGQIYRSTSSLKYKKDILDYDKGLNEVLQMRPVYFKGISNKDGDKQFAGLIAEEIHNLGLNEFVTYAEDGTPDALAYQNMIALLTKAIQELSTKVTELENKLN